jgi:hypothetical protein
MYDPRIGRFTQTDPILSRRATAHYAYAGNNPISKVDPYGLREGDWWDPRTYAGASAAEIHDWLAENARLIRHDFVEAVKIAPEVAGNLVGWGNRHSTIAETFSSGHAVVSGSAEVQTVGNKLSFGAIPPAPTDYEDPQFNQPARLGVKAGETTTLALDVAMMFSGPGTVTTLRPGPVAVLADGSTAVTTVSTSISVPSAAQAYGAANLVNNMAGGASGSSSGSGSTADQPKTHGHHTYPKALGGHPDQKLADLLDFQHIGQGGVHSDLASFEGGWLYPKKGMPGAKIVEQYGSKTVEEGLRRFYSQPKWNHLLETFEEAVKFTAENPQ